MVNDCIFLNPVRKGLKEFCFNFVVKYLFHCLASGSYIRLK
jgi:hypothetical protein